MIAALGLLRVAKLPDIPGRDALRRPDDALGPLGPRRRPRPASGSAIIGTGASANQIVPAIAPTAGEVVIYQRSAALDDVAPEVRQGARRRREAAVRRRSRPTGSGTASASRGSSATGSPRWCRIDPDWPHIPSARSTRPATSCGPSSPSTSSAQVGDRPELIDKLRAQLPALRQADAGRQRLVPGAAARQRPARHGADPAHHRERRHHVGRPRRARRARVRHRLHTPTGCCGRSQVTGAGGVDVTARLDDSPEAYLGIAAGRCPNLFITPGPNGVPGHGGNGMLRSPSATCATSSRCLRALFEERARSHDDPPEALQAYVDELCAELPTFVQSLRAVDNWYRATATG